MNPEALTFLGVLVSVIASVLVARIGARSTSDSARETSAVNFAADLTRRLETVEREIKDLREELRGANRVITAATGYIDALLWWLRTGRSGTMPRPPQVIRDHLDPNLLDDPQE